VKRFREHAASLTQSELVRRIHLLSAKGAPVQPPAPRDTVERWSTGEAKDPIVALEERLGPDFAERARTDTRFYEENRAEIFKLTRLRQERAEQERIDASRRDARERHTVRRAKEDEARAAKEAEQEAIDVAQAELQNQSWLDTAKTSE
jgi:hypothetical protein